MSVYQKINSITKYEGMPKGLKTKHRSKTACFDLYFIAGVDCHCDNQDSNGEHGEDDKEDLCPEPESDSYGDREQRSKEDDDDDDSYPDLQKTINECESESESDSESDSE